MPLLLSLAAFEDTVVGAGPEGLFIYREAVLTPLPQPMTALYACAVAGDRLLVAGAPFGVASRLIEGNDLHSGADREWQGGWMDHTQAPALALAAMPVAHGENPVLLAGTAGDGILRSTNRGINWSVCNFGLQEFMILSLAWGPRPASKHWLERQVAFAGGESGLYRSPAAGLAWKHVAQGPQDAVQAVAVAPDFHTSGLVVAGTESQGIWQSSDGGRTFLRVAESPQRVDALIATNAGFYAGTPDGVLHSGDGATWRPIPDTPAALALLQLGDTLYIAGEHGVAVLSA